MADGEPTRGLAGVARAVLAVAAVVAIVVVAARAARSLVTYWVPAVGPNSAAPAMDLAALGVLQVLLIALTFAVARLFGPWRHTLALRPPPRDPVLWLKAVGISTIVLGLYTAGALVWFRDAVLTDLDLFRPMIEAAGPPLAILVLGVGAPLSEELLFRGFLIGQLARTRLGFYGAALVATLGWTALHAGYGPVGLVEVFLAGLLMSWALWISRSIWVPIALHAIYNLLVLALLLTVGV